MQVVLHAIKNFKPINWINLLYKFLTTKLIQCTYKCTCNGTNCYLYLSVCIWYFRSVLPVELSRYIGIIVSAIMDFVENHVFCHLSQVKRKLWS